MTSAKAEAGSAEVYPLRYQAHRVLRPGQSEMIQHALSALEKGGALIAAAPTGIGKTAAALAAALEISKEMGDRRKTIMFLTGRQSQHRIVVETVRDINSRLGPEEHRVSLVDMIGQAGMCVQPFANEHPILFSQLCSQARSKRTCRPFIQAAEDLNDMIHSTPLHVHELVSLARDNTANGISAPVCAWRAGRDCASSADVVVCDYNHLFDDGVRSASLSGMGLELENLIVIVDEAHNLPGRIRSGLERKITPEMVRNAAFEVEEFLEQMVRIVGPDDLIVEQIRWVHQVLGRLRPSISAWFRKMAVEVAASSTQRRDSQQRRVQIAEFQVILEEAFAAVDGDSSQTTLGQEGIESQKNGTGPVSERRMSVLAEVLAGVNVEQEEEGGEPQRLASHRFAGLLDAVNRYGNTTALALVFDQAGQNGTITSHLLDPSLVSEPVFSQVSGSILMSGTLYPPEMYSNLLGLDGEGTSLVAYDSPFLAEKRPVAIASDVTTLFAQRSAGMTAKIQAHIEAMIRATPGHIAVFAPSYNLLNEYLAGRHWGGVKPLLEERGWGKQRIDRLLTDLEDARQRGTRVLLGGVYGGKLAEGIDYHNNLLDAAICIGIPMAPPSVEGEALKEYMEDKVGKGTGFRWATIQPAMNSVLQALGRPIRGFGDRAFILLLDQRHQRGHYRSCLPKSINSITVPDAKTTELIARRFFDRTPPQLGEEIEGNRVVN